MGGRTDRLRREIGELARANSTATVLFHHAVAERLGLGPSDHKCLDLVRERGPVTSAELAALTGLTTGAIAGVVGRLLRAGFVSRAADPHDGRKQLLSITPQALQRIGELFADLAEESNAELLQGYDDDQLATIADFLRRATGFARHRTALLRARTLIDGRRGPRTPTKGERG